MHPFPGNRRAAVSLTYDDCLPCHRTLVAPELTTLGLAGTFYCPAGSDDLHDHVEAWRAVAASGHELGNHTCFHPCRRHAGAAWPEAAYDLTTYSRRRIVDEIRLAERVLRLVDGRERRSFAATCGNTTVGPDGAEESFLDDLGRSATIVRSGEAGVIPLRRPDLVVGSITADGAAAAGIIAAIEPVLVGGGWVVILAHGVGPGTHGLFVDVDVHAKVIEWIAERSTDLWSATVSDVAACLHALPG